jgi:hypothetical protein
MIAKFSGHAIVRDGAVAGFVDDPDEPADPSESVRLELIDPAYLDLPNPSRGDVESGHQRPYHFRAAFADLREAIEEAAKPYDEAWICGKCLRATLGTIALTAAAARIRELFDEDDRR